MKNKFIVLFVLMIGYNGIGQNFDRLSIEGAYNISVPFSASVVSAGDGNYNSYNGFNLGIRYMFNQKWGVKAEVAYNGYHGDKNQGTDFLRLDAQAFYNLGYLLDLPRSTNDKFGLLVHSGFGVSQIKSLYANTTEHTGNFLLGVTPLFRLSDQLTLSGDISYITNFKQHDHFDGVPFDTLTGAYKVGHSINFAFGFVFYLGENKKHADWY